MAKNFWGFWKSYEVTKDKTLEVTLHQVNWYCLFDISLTYHPRNEDHTGISFYIILVGICFEINFHDNRHKEEYPWTDSQ